MSISKYYKERIPILNWKELAPVEYLYTCQCETIIKLALASYKQKDEEDYVLYIIPVPILPKNVIIG